MSKKMLQLVLILGLLFSNITSVHSEDSSMQSWQVTSQVGGPAQGIAVQGNYAYIGVGPRLVVVDISNPSNPIQVGATAMLDDFVAGVAVSGTQAYVAAGSAGLYIVDITTPTNPIKVGAWNSPGFAESVTVSGSTAYLADGPYGLRVVDVTNPTAPLEIGHVFDMNYAYDVAINGFYAYVAAGGAGLLVVEISNPGHPVEAGSYDTPGNARGVAATGGLIWVADERSGMHVINAADPLHPSFVGSLQTQGWAFDVNVVGNLAFVAAAFGGLRVVNVNDPAHPVEIGGLAWKQSNAAGIAVAGSQVYIAERKGGLRVVNAANPASPVQSGYFNVMAFAHSVVVDGNYAYVAAGFDGVRIFNLSNPAKPVEVGKYLVDGLIYTLKLSGTRLYAGTFLNSPERGLYVLDISDPTHPRNIGFYGDISECWGIDVAGSTVYVADAGDLKIFNFSNPPTLNLMGSYPMVPRGLTVRDGLAYVSQEFDGVKIYNVSNPAAISLVGSFKAADSFTHGPVTLAGNYAYVSENRGLRILNVANPTNPSEVSYTPTHDGTNWLALSGSRVYVSEGAYGFSVYDVSYPAVPLRINQTSVLGSVQALALSGGRVFTASAEGGLQIFGETGGSVLSLPAPLPDLSPVSEAKQIAPVHRSLLLSPTQEIPAEASAPERLATTCTVTTAANSGSGSLRSCLENQAAGDVILFSPAVFPPSAPVTIHVGTARLPWLSRGNVTVDASNAGVILDGSSVSGNWDPGFGINSDNNTVRGVQIVNFPVGIDVLGHNNRIGGSRQVGSGLTGQGNVISGNRQVGIAISLGAHGNLVLGNLVGLNYTGTQANPNHGAGISINQAANNTIGSLNPGEDNVVSANEYEGIMLYGYATLGNKVIGNKVGTDITGNVNLGNKGVGVYVESGSAYTLAHGNLISGNRVAELLVWDFMTDFNVLTGNRISTNLAGTQVLPNLSDKGIATGNAAYTRIGGTAPGEGNLVGNPGGVWVDAPFGANTLMQGNRIGLNSAGTAVLPNAGGVVLGGLSRTILGGATPAEANYVTTDGNFSVYARSPNNAVLGNFFGLATDDLTPLSTAGFQIYAQRGGNIIQGNRIANTTSAGIWVDGSQANTIRRNSIYANPFKGIFLENGGNNDLPAPVITLNPMGGTGTACPNCVIELFLDAGNQGRVYLDSVSTDSSGLFNFPYYCPLVYANLTATATDILGNTSSFSEPHTVPWDCNAARTAPSLSSIVPDTKQAPSASVTMQVTGTNFAPDSVVWWNGQNLLTIYISATQLQAVIPSYLLRDGGSIPVSIFTPLPGGGESTPMIFSILPPWKAYLPTIRK